MSLFSAALSCSHEILSQECNLFRVRVRRRRKNFAIVTPIYMLLLGVILMTAWAASSVHFGLSGVVILSAIYFTLSNRIYEGTVAK